METGQQHLQKLPVKIQIALRKNMELQDRTDRYTREYPTISSFLNSSCTWKKTKQGQEFWETLFNKLKVS